MEYKLRGHHLICLQFYKGEGYDKSFIQNLEKIVKSWEENPVKVIDSADDICKKCPYLKEGRCHLPNSGEKEIKRLDRLALKLLKIKPKEKVEKRFVLNSLPRVIDAWKSQACQDCQWQGLCHI